MASLLVWQNCLQQLYMIQIWIWKINWKDSKLKKKKKTHNSHDCILHIWSTDTQKRLIQLKSIGQGLVLLWRAVFRMRHSKIEQIKNLINSRFNPWRRHVK